MNLERDQATLGQEAMVGAADGDGVALKKRRYAKPRLEALGDLVSATLAPSPGQFESGRGSGFRPPSP